VLLGGQNAKGCQLQVDSLVLEQLYMIYGSISSPIGLISIPKHCCSILSSTCKLSWHSCKDDIQNISGSLFYYCLFAENSNVFAFVKNVNAISPFEFNFSVIL
jgi:hypothetical protein